MAVDKREFSLALTVGTVSYNGFTFPAPFRSKVQITPVYDRANRVIKYRRYSLTIETEILPADLELSPGTPIDLPMQTLRQQLTTEGADLHFRDQGLGEDLYVHKGNVIEFGPKPRMLIWEPIGSNLACRIVWQCDFTIEQCDRNSIPSGLAIENLAEFSYGMQFGLTPDGLVTRTISGVAEVFVGRSGNSITNTADYVRSRLDFPQLAGFKRSQSYNLSNDKRFLDFTITDTEIGSENPYHPKMVEMDVTHRVSGSLLASKGPWMNSLDGTIQVAPGVHRSLAWKAFLVIVKDRILDLRGAKEEGAAEDRTTVILQRFEISEQIYGRSMSFSISWKFTTSIKTLFADAGLFRPVPTGGDGWATWHKSMVWIERPYGIAEIGHIPGDDRLVNVCKPSPPGFSYKDVKRKIDGEKIENLFKQEPPKPENSWLEYQYRTYVIRDTNIIRQRILGGSDATHEAGINVTTAFTLGFKSMPSVAETLIQMPTASMTVLVLYGFAERIGHDILDEDMPRVVKITGVVGKPVLLWQKIVASHKIGTSLEGFPIYRAAWRKAYVMPRADANIEIDIESEVRKTRFLTKPK